MLESMSSTTEEVNFPLIILLLREGLLLGQFLPWEAFISGYVHFPLASSFIEAQCFWESLNIFFFFKYLSNFAQISAAS